MMHHQQPAAVAPYYYGQNQPQFFPPQFHGYLNAPQQRPPYLPSYYTPGPPLLPTSIAPTNVPLNSYEPVSTPLDILDNGAPVQSISSSNLSSLSVDSSTGAVVASSVSYVGQDDSFQDQSVVGNDGSEQPSSEQVGQEQDSVNEYLEYESKMGKEAGLQDEPCQLDSQPIYSDANVEEQNVEECDQTERQDVLESQSPDHLATQLDEVKIEDCGDESNVGVEKNIEKEQPVESIEKPVVDDSDNKKEPETSAEVSQTDEPSAPPAPATTFSWASKLFGSSNSATANGAVQPTTSTASAKAAFDPEVFIQKPASTYQPRPSSSQTALASSKIGGDKNVTIVPVEQDEIALQLAQKIRDRIQLKHSLPTIIPCGLVNRGNWCYVNAVSFSV